MYKKHCLTGISGRKNKQANKNMLLVGLACRWTSPMALGTLKPTSSTAEPTLKTCTGCADLNPSDYKESLETQLCHRQLILDKLFSNKILLWGDQIDRKKPLNCKVFKTYLRFSFPVILSLAPFETCNNAKNEKVGKYHDLTKAVMVLSKSPYKGKKICKAVIIWAEIIVLCVQHWYSPNHRTLYWINILEAHSTEYFQYFASLV